MDHERSEKLWFLFMQVAQLGVGQGAETIRAHNITPPQYLILKNLHDNPDLTQQQLADALVVTKGNVSQILKLMERDGLIIREPGAGGSNRIILTPVAKQVFAPLDGDHRAFTQQFFAGLSEAEAEQFAVLLNKLLDNFTNGSEDTVICEDAHVDATNRQ